MSIALFNEEFNDGGFPVKNASYWKRKYNKEKKKLQALLSYLNPDKDGDYFICKEAMEELFPNKSVD